MILKFGRRRFLYGSAGTMLALPFLESMISSTALGASSPRRFIVIYFPNGTPLEYWTPIGTRTEWEMGPIMAPLSPLKSKINVISNLENYSALEMDLETEPSHSRCAGAFLTCADADEFRKRINLGQFDIGNAISVDQMIARQMAQISPVPSLQVGLSTYHSETDHRHDSLSRSISWASATEPLYKLVSPQSVYDKLVGPRLPQKSILDYVKSETKALTGKLSGKDREVFEKYLNSIRNIENRLDKMEENSLKILSFQRPTADYQVDKVPENYNRHDHAILMNDLIKLALETDTTRVVTYMLDDARSDFAYSHVQVSEFNKNLPSHGNVGNYHSSQHESTRVNEYASAGKWFCEVTQDLCAKLDMVKEGDQSVLDNSVVLLGSGMNGPDHDANNLPVLTVGSAGGLLRTGQHISFEGYPKDRPLRDLYATISDRVFGIRDEIGVNKMGKLQRVIDEILV